MRVLDGVEIVEGKGTVLGVNLERFIVTNGDFVAWLFENDALFPNYFAGGLVTSLTIYSHS